MRLRDDQIKRLAEAVLAALDQERLISLKGERGGVIATICRSVAADVAAEAAIEREAERVLEENLRALGRGAAAIDRHRMLRMIKEKLAKERKFVL